MFYVVLSLARCQICRVALNSDDGSYRRLSVYRAHAAHPTIFTYTHIKRLVYVLQNVWVSKSQNKLSYLCNDASLGMWRYFCVLKLQFNDGNGGSSRDIEWKIFLEKYGRKLLFLKSSNYQKLCISPMYVYYFV